MTIKTFKKLCMKACTKKADEIHDYFIRLEEILQETISEESTELQKQLEASNALLKSTESALKSQHEKFKKLVRKKYYDTEPGQTVYVYKNDVTDPNSVIRVGKTDNIKSRETHYNTSNNTDPVNISEIEQFVMERCKVGYIYRTSHKTLYDEFENWKQVGSGDYVLDRDTKTKPVFLILFSLA